MIDLTGQVFGFWTVLEEAGRDKNRKVMWLCRCLCGRECRVRGSTLRSGGSNKCRPCAMRRNSRRRSLHHVPAYEHGKKKPEYSVYNNMINRCYNPKTNGYPIYGGRGIQVCEQWRRSGKGGRLSGYTQFVLDMGLKPKEEFSLDRKDCNGDYTPENCQWAPEWMQQANTRSTRILIATTVKIGRSLEFLVNAMNIDVEKEAWSGQGNCP